MENLECLSRCFMGCISVPSSLEEGLSSLFIVQSFSVLITLCEKYLNFSRTIIFEDKDSLNRA